MDWKRAPFDHEGSRCKVGLPVAAASPSMPEFSSCIRALSIPLAAMLGLCVHPALAATGQPGDRPEAKAGARPLAGSSEALVRHQRWQFATEPVATAGAAAPRIDFVGPALQASVRSALALWAGETARSDDTLVFAALESPAARLAPAHPVLRLQQLVEGIPVHGANVSVLLDDSGAVRSIAGALATGATPASATARHRDPAAAVRAAVVAATGAESGGLRRQPANDANGSPAFQLDASERFHPALPATARALWFPAGDGLRAAYEVQLVGTVPASRRPLAQRLLIDAGTGAVLRTDQLVHDVRTLARPAPCPAPCADSGFLYRVLADRRGVPLTDPFGMTSPHPTALRDGHLPAGAPAPRLLRLAHGGILTGDPWLPDQATTTVGNNVDAFFQALAVDAGQYRTDLFGSWSPQFQSDRGDFRASVTSPGRFDHHYQVAIAPLDYVQRPGAPSQPVPTGSTQLNAKIVQAFHAGNWLHDLFYDLGFDEAAGNAQMDNYGRGGIAGDPLQIHAGFSTTFAFAPPDGTAPALTLGRNEFSLSNRDVSGFDFGVFAHEWAHTMFVRLTTMGPRGQQGALNEGTADFIGVFLMLEPGQRYAAPATGDFHGAYPIGAYMNLDYDFPFDDMPPAGSPGYPDNTYYHGIRRFPYSASTAVNPLSLAHISPDNPLPPGSQPFDWKLRSFNAAEIHTAGEVWASALWQCAGNIMAAAPARQFGLRQRQVLADLVAALKLFPTDATYTEARDAMLAAVRARDEDDHLRCRAGFAARGFGVGAISPPRASTDLRGVVESFVDGPLP
jgi:hypothetical protein